MHRGQRRRYRGSEPLLYLQSITLSVHDVGVIFSRIVNVLGLRKVMVWRGFWSLAKRSLDWPGAHECSRGMRSSSSSPCAGAARCWDFWFCLGGLMHGNGECQS